MVDIPTLNIDEHSNLSDLPKNAYWEIDFPNNIKIINSLLSIQIHKINRKKKPPQNFSDRGLIIIYLITDY